jgi:hypothetical protein
MSDRPAIITRHADAGRHPRHFRAEHCQVVDADLRRHDGVGALPVRQW